MSLSLGYAIPNPDWDISWAKPPLVSLDEQSPERIEAEADDLMAWAASLRKTARKMRRFAAEKRNAELA